MTHLFLQLVDDARAPFGPAGTTSIFLVWLGLGQDFPQHLAGFVRAAAFRLGIGRGLPQEAFDNSTGPLPTSVRHLSRRHRSLHRPISHMAVAGGIAADRRPTEGAAFSVRPNGIHT